MIGVLVYSKKKGNNHEQMANHAEMNAIYNAAENGVSLKGSTLYVYGLPVCNDCAKGLVQAGIKRIVTPKQDVPKNWQDSVRDSALMFDEVGILWDWIEY